ncbi:MAG: TraB/GumN family protein, partial [Gammaproteobacteria bacterium]|nr:TraB/GumN family protein [Gammaproteobacteria bacterium]
SDDPRVTKIPPIVTFSFETSSLFILEVELTQKNTKQAMQAMFFTGNQTLEGILPTDLLNQCLKLLGQRGVSKQQAIKLKPWAVFTFLNTPNQEQAFLDQILYSNAKEKGIEIQGLESMAEQISVFDNLSMDIQVKLLQDSVNHFDELNHMLEQTIAVYLSRDLKRLEKFNQDYLTFTDEKTGQLLNDTLIIQRNYRMAKRLIPILQQHQAFIAVGALHLPGETGLIQLLRNHGYQLKPLY